MIYYFFLLKKLKFGTKDINQHPCNFLVWLENFKRVYELQIFSFDQNEVKPCFEKLIRTFQTIGYVVWLVVSSSTFSKENQYQKQQHLLIKRQDTFILSTKMGTEQSKNNDTQPKQKQMTRQERSAQQAQKAIGR